jgi:hypothetical protein
MRVYDISIRNITWLGRRIRKVQILVSCIVMHLHIIQKYLLNSIAIRDLNTLQQIVLLLLRVSVIVVLFKRGKLGTSKLVSFQ